jgi:hypothetical protein
MELPWSYKMLIGLLSWSVFPIFIVSCHTLLEILPVLFVHLNSLLLLVCCINSQKANYRCSTRENKIINVNKITTFSLSRNYMTVEKVSSQRQLVTEYINIFGIIIKLN